MRGLLLCFALVVGLLPGKVEDALRLGQVVHVTVDGVENLLFFNPVAAPPVFIDGADRAVDR
jgi:hypothetical protein